MAQANMDLGIFQKTKCTDGISTRDSAGYSVVAMDAPSRHRGGVAIFYWPSPIFAVKSVRQFGPNIIGFQLAMGARRSYIIGCYLAPNDTSTIESVVAALKEWPQGTTLIVEKDLNTTLSDPENDRRGTELVAALTEVGLEDMVAHFLLRQRRWCRERRTWKMVQEGKVFRSWTDYILGTYRRLFWNISVRDPRHNTDHYMVLGCLRSAPKRGQVR